jgi:virginiamycin A acetyltransferase
MNGANHQMNAATTFPFYVMDGWQQDAPKINDLPFKGNTIVGNDCWIGQNVTILPGVHIGNGVIIGANSVVTKDLPSYSICCGNPCVIKKMRFSDEIIKILEELKWWDRSIEEIQKIIPIITKANPTKEELLKIIE